MTTIARPYVAAAFEYALAHRDLNAWEDMLQFAGAISADSRVQDLLMSPNTTQQNATDFFCSALSTRLNDERKNFIKVLAANKRLTALPEIAARFTEYKADYEKTLNVDVTSAIPLTGEYQQKLIQALSIRFQRQVTLDCVVDESLIGGAVIRAGDTVIDGSIRGKLARLIDFI